ncbi:NYN domain-containing protein [Corynebacterium choanae]|uniref:NYN domain protein n=1 Tax=Corynebacterium choanae TaxID=1862358 RepID=A0A3G6J981_9CORY|nr:NYN domain-containing protein [Corynebacterium choanae]AZA12584.1 NYN domain protein [Corynebacterium choanae]
MTSAHTDTSDIAVTASQPLPPPGDREILLIWDAPNVDMGLGAILGGRPSSVNRPRFDAVGLWLLDYCDQRAAELGHTPVPEATVFTNMLRGSEDALRSWVEALRNVGFSVFAKPKLHDDSDVDPDMVAHIRRRFEQNVLDGVVVASADGQNFKEILDELAAAGIPVTVIGFREHASWATAADNLQFVDLEDIPGVFLKPLPRIQLEMLPDQGGWMPPLRPLSCLRK